MEEDDEVRLPSIDQTEREKTEAALWVERIEQDHPVIKAQSMLTKRRVFV